jgi:hypothetical protein
MNRHVQLDEKLNALRNADSFRKWYSLDDRRVCVLCDRLITGRMIDVWQDNRGGYHLHCPTPGCLATPRDWFYHGPVRARVPKVMTTPPLAVYAQATAHR